MIKPFFIFMLTTVILTASCSSTTIVDKKFFASPARKRVIGLVGYQSQYIQTSPGALLSEEGGGATLIEGDDEYKAALDEKCLKAIGEVLKSKSVSFSFDAGPFRNVPQLEDLDILGLENVNMDEDVIERLKEEAKNRNVRLIRKFIAENDLDGAVRVESRYSHLGVGFKLAVQTFWTIYDSEGGTVLFVESDSVDEEGRSFAYMMDTKLENEIISLTKENAGKMLLAIRKGGD